MNKPTREDYKELSKNDLIDICIEQMDIILAQRSREADLVFNMAAFSLETEGILESNLYKKSFGLGLPTWAETRLQTLSKGVKDVLP